MTNILKEGHIKKGGLNTAPPTPKLGPPPGQSVQRKRTTTEELEIRGMALQAMMQVEELKAKQTRWVKCSERLPDEPLTSDARYLLIDDNGRFWFGTQLRGVWFVYGLRVGDRHPNIVAWLENVPEFVP